MTAAPAPDPYLVLGVTAEASDDDLDHAFRGLVRRLHPDTRTPPEPDAGADQRLQELLTAYATLRDPISRAAYDRTRTKPAPAPSPPTPPPRLHVAPPPSTPIWIRPAIRVGPVHWEPPQARSRAERIG